ncbi:MAG: hypothetical protein FJY37_13770 [Betaproteobacteria bacterium]|nr:hypothetical protein [Betaproteobacteria bacterium]
MGGLYASHGDQQVVGVKAAEVVLIAILENVLRQPVQRYTARRQGVQDLVFIDGMVVVVLDDGIRPGRAGHGV